MLLDSECGELGGKEGVAVRSKAVLVIANVMTPTRPLSSQCEMPYVIGTVTCDWGESRPWKSRKAEKRNAEAVEMYWMMLYHN